MSEKITAANLDTVIQKNKENRHLSTSLCPDKDKMKVFLTWANKIVIDINYPQL